ncbi:MAG TPA: SRPBCC domain-containing protein [Vicinamibacteria bacterium]
MAQTNVPPALSLRATRTFAAPRERVFRAWTTPEAIARWFIEPTDGHWTEAPQLDPRPGGQYRFAGESGGKPWCIHGTYREVLEPTRLVFTWEWEDHPNPGDSGQTLVTIDFHDRGGQTEVVLAQQGFSHEASRQDHVTGWAECFDAIDRLVTAAEAGA